MNYPILVTCAIIEKEGKYLVTQRPDDGRHNGGRWEFPGGKLDFGENPRDSLKREIKEEIDIEVEVKEIFDISSNLYGDKHVVLLGFHCNYVSGEIDKKDISDFKWLNTSEMKTYDITEADLPFIEKLVSNK